MKPISTCRSDSSRKIPFLSILSFLLFTSLSIAIDVPEPEQIAPTPDEQFRSMVLDIAEKENIAASDYGSLATQTIALGQAARQGGTPLPDPIIHDALEAVEAGRNIDLFSADWTKLEEDLLALLEKPPEQDQQQQQDQENQDQENSEENQEQQDQQGDSSEQQKNQDQKEQQEGEESGEQQDQQSQEQNGESGEQENQEQQGQEGQEPSEPQEPQQGGSKMGDLDEQEQDQNVELSEEDMNQAEQQDMQSVGGQQQAPQKVDAEKAVILQKLEQLKQQDDPAKLFQILQEAESGEKAKQQPNAKDW